MTLIAFNDTIKLVDIDEYDGDLSFVIRKVLFASSDLVSDNAWNEQIQNLSKLLIVADFLVATYKRCLLLKLLHVDVNAPHDRDKYP